MECCFSLTFVAFFNKRRMNLKRYFWYFVFNANMIIFFPENLNKFNSKQCTEILTKLKEYIK